MGCVDEPTDLNERRNLLRGPAWDAVVAAVVAEAAMVAELEREAA
jgi:hypothetical protein